MIQRVVWYIRFVWHGAWASRYGKRHAYHLKKQEKFFHRLEELPTQEPAE